jgi:hypothetical protein
VRTGRAEQQRPAVATQREAHVVDEEGGHEEQRIRREDLAGQLVELEPRERSQQEDEQHDRQDERDDRARLAQPPGERDLLARDLRNGLGAARRLDAVDRLVHWAAGAPRTRRLPRAALTALASGVSARTT